MCESRRGHLTPLGDSLAPHTLLEAPVWMAAWVLMLVPAASNPWG